MTKGAFCPLRWSEVASSPVLAAWVAVPRLSIWAGNVLTDPLVSETATLTSARCCCAHGCALRGDLNRSSGSLAQSYGPRECCGADRHEGGMKRFDAFVGSSFED